MKSALGATTPPQPPLYPRLMLTGHGAVVLLASPQVGTVVYGSGPHKLGDYSSSWKAYHWKPFTGSVKLEN